MRKYTLLTLISIIGAVLLISGCGNPKNNMSPDERISYMLYEKYGKQFYVKEASEETADMAFEEGCYVAKVYSDDTGEYFEAILYKRSGKLKDNYAKTIYGKQIEQLVNGILKNDVNIKKYTYSPVYYKSENVWTDFNRYIKSGDVCVEGEIVISASSDKEAAKNIYAVVKKMSESNLIYSMEFTYNARKTRIANTFEEPSYESILRQLQQ